MKPDSGLFVVITTINAKSCGILEYEGMADLRVLLVGDRKTPALDDGPNSEFLAVDQQASLGFMLASALPYDHYTRKNIGYLYAMRQGAKLIYDTDDDNRPMDNWRIPDFRSNAVLSGDDRFCNVYQHFTGKKVWPRGLPLRHIRGASGFHQETASQPNIGVWQGLADGDPDVDAIYRLVDNEAVTFERKDGVWLRPHCYCPFNSQNTFWQSRFFPLLYLPATTSFRFTDILRGYIAQRLLWEEGHHLGFMEATVFQERNAHDYMKDFADEIDVYLQTEQVVQILEELPLSGGLPDKLRQIYRALQAASVVEAEELELVDLWLDDCSKATGARL